MYGDQFGEFVCGYWGLKGKVCPHSCYNQCVLYLNFIIKPTVDKRSSSLLWPECHGPLEVTETAFQCSVSLWATILISRAQLFKCSNVLEGVDAVNGSAILILIVLPAWNFAVIDMDPLTRGVNDHHMSLLLGLELTATSILHPLMQDQK